MSNTIARPFGPTFRTKLDLMGIRYMVPPEGEGAGGDDGGDGDGGESKYTPPASQKDLDDIVERRLARERDKYKGYDDFKAKAEQFDALEADKKTPDQRAIDDAKAEAAGEVTQKFLWRIVTTETKSIARDLGFIDPDDALRVIDAEKLPVKDDEPDVDEIKKAVEKLAKDKPHLVREESTRKPRPRPHPAPGDKQDDTPKGGKGKAAAALRQLGTARRSS